jgi:hypothetical protein
MPSRAAQGSGLGSSAGGRSKLIGKRKKDKRGVPDDDLIEKVPTYNVGTRHLAD